MQGSQHVLAGRYGKALFLAAEAAQQEEQVLKDIAAAHRQLLDFAPFFRNPRVSSSDKKRRLQELLGARVGPLALKFLAMLVDKKRFELLPQIGVQLERSLAEKKRTARAHVRAAAPLSPDDAERLKKLLSSFSGKSVDLDIKEDPELLGGVVVHLGDWVLDSSLRGQLRRLKEELISH